jgi:hypothetical protein
LEQWRKYRWAVGYGEGHTKSYVAVELKAVAGIPVK